MSRGRKLLIFIIILLIIGLIYLGSVLYSDSHSKNESTSVEDKTKDIEDIVKEEKYMAIAKLKGENSLFTISEDGTIKKKDISVLQTTGAGSRSFSINENNIYYIDENKNLNLYDSKMQESIKLEEVITTDHTDLYSVNNGVFIFIEGRAYLYDGKAKTLLELELDSPVNINNRYYNKLTNIMYYYDYEKKIMSYNLETKQTLEEIRGYSILGNLSTTSNLVLQKDNKYYLYNYESKKLEEFFELKEDKDSVIYLDNSSFIYIHENKLIKRPLKIENDTKEDVLAEIDVSKDSNEKLISFYDLHTSNAIFVAKVSDSKVKNVYKVDFYQKNSLDVSDKLKDIEIDFLDLND